MEFGQVRPLNAQVVEERMQELKAHPPGAMLRLPVWMEAGVSPDHLIGNAKEISRICDKNI